MARSRSPYGTGASRSAADVPVPAKNVVLPCGWGRLLFAQTFPEAADLAAALEDEQSEQRDIAFYLTDPHVVLNVSPQTLFLDPSHTFRLMLEDVRPMRRKLVDIKVAPVTRKADLVEANRIYAAQKMVPLDVDFVWKHRRDPTLHYAFARHARSGDILGVAMGVNHGRVFGDVERGSSLWSLAVDPQAELPGVGEALTRHYIDHFRECGCRQMDLSVMHWNEAAIALYEKLGFQRVPVFAVKRRNRINERLFVGEPPGGNFNPYARIIIDEAMRRGIAVDPLDPEGGYFRLTLGGRSITCRESLTELTSAIAYCRCQDKALTRKVVTGAGLKMPEQRPAGGPEENAAFLKRHRRVVVKPAVGEQGAGVAVNLTTADEVESAVGAARELCDRVVLEKFCEGEDLRIIVIRNEAVAAAVRRPAEIVGTGRHTVRELIESLSRRRQAATGGESSIPVDAETSRCLAGQGCDWKTVPKKGRRIRVRNTANLHTGGTIHDVTERLHPELARVAVAAARALQIPVVGLDLLTPSIEKPEYVIIEANERPGLANHEPQPTAERFIDLLFPQTAEPHARLHG